jgi:hypothetical protein
MTAAALAMAGHRVVTLWALARIARTQRPRTAVVTGH